LFSTTLLQLGAWSSLFVQISNYFILGSQLTPQPISSFSSSPNMYLIRLLIVGETGVGKTSVLVRFNENMFIIDQKTTIGVDYKAKEINVDNEKVKLQVSSLLFIIMFVLIVIIIVMSMFRFGTLLVKNDFGR
jgi:hypothetical protein